MEYTLFRALEYERYGKHITKGFSSVDEFVRIANIVLNRKKSRAGKSLEHPQLIVNGFEATVNLLTPSLKRCPHLGCTLKWNPQEHSWDCPCHGSRFTQEGKLIDNPATGDLRK